MSRLVLLGGEAALGWTLVGSALAVLTALMLPVGRNQPHHRLPAPDESHGVLRAMISNGLPLAFAASALIQGAHGFYYGFSAVAWRAGSSEPPPPRPVLPSAVDSVLHASGHVSIS